MDMTSGDLIEDIRRVARLAMLELNEEESKQIAVQFKMILDQLQTLGELDTRGINPFRLEDMDPMPWRADEVHIWNRYSEVLSQAPESEDGYFKVPRIVREDRDEK